MHATTSCLGPLAPAAARAAPDGFGRAALERRLSDLAPGGVCIAAAVTCGTGGLLHRRFTLTRSGLSPGPGGLLSVALSRGSPRVAVGHHPALRSPDVPQP